MTNHTNHTNHDDGAATVRPAVTGRAAARRFAAQRARRVAAYAAAMLRDMDRDADDDGAGAGWSVVVLLPTGAVEILATLPTVGDAAEIAAGHHCARHRDGAAIRDGGRVVIVPAWHADAMAADVDRAARR